MLIGLACIYQLYLLKEDGECCRKGRRISFYFESPFSLYHLNPSLKRQRSPFSTLVWCFLLYCFSDPRTAPRNWTCKVSTMVTKMKGIYKAGFKYISNIFVVKDREMEIGLPTDVKHVAHIGWDGPSGSAPTWMNEFKTGPGFTASSIGNSGSALSPWSSQDFGGHQSDMYKDIPSAELPDIPKTKHKRKKNKCTSSPRSTSSSTSRSSRAAKSKAKFVEGSPKPTNIEIA